MMTLWSSSMRGLGRFWSFVFAGLAAVGAVAAVPGCTAAVVAGAGAVTYAYVEGDAEGYLRRNPNEVEAAARSVLLQAGVREIDREVTEQGRVELDGETETGTNIRVVIKPKPEATFASVRVGLVGNNASSAALFKKLRAELGITNQ